MKKLTAELFISLDGVVEEPEEWHLPYFSAEMTALGAGLEAADVLLLGRRTYEDLAGVWPRREGEGGADAQFAERLGDTRKIVVSGRRLEFAWRNTELLQGDLLEAVTALKDGPGAGRIAVSGSVSVVRRLLEAGLVDELHLLVHPIAVRRGMRLFEEGEPIPLRLIRSQAFTTGVLYLVYAPAETAGEPAPGRWLRRRPSVPRRLRVRPQSLMAPMPGAPGPADGVPGEDPSPGLPAPDATTSDRRGGLDGRPDPR